jgi:two-component system, cell cycle sensor histidine kinase and response regulator CckA
VSVPALLLAAVAAVAVPSLLGLALARRSLRRRLAALQLELAERTRALEESHEHLQATPAEGGRAPGSEAPLPATPEERARIEDQLRQSQKMEAIGRLAGGVAHDFNNLVTVICSNADLALGSLPEAHPARDCLVDIGHAAERAGALTRQLLAFSRKQALEQRPIDLRQLVLEMRRLLGRVLGEQIRLQLDVPAELDAVLADPGQLEQVILNLGMNARDALEGGGRVAISARSADADELPQGVRCAGPRRFVRLTFADDGPGMTPEVKARLFEPFFTTKPRGKGTGLGLSTVYGIVRQHGGAIAVRSTPGKGAAFDVFLPSTDPAQKPETRAPGLTPMPGGTETVVLVEDDRLVRVTAEKILERLGYNVLVAHDAREGLSLLKTHPQPVELLLTDVVMPGMSGPEMAFRALEGRPDLRILYMSGYPHVFVDDAGVIGDGVELLRKPFTPETLASRVRGILGPPRLEAAPPLVAPLPRPPVSLAPAVAGREAARATG